MNVNRAASQPHLQIRTEEPRDYEAVGAVVAAAFDGRPNEPALVEGIRRAEDFRPEFSLVAEHDGIIVGHVLLSYVTLTDDSHRDRRVLALAPMSVAPAWQGRGIGSRLIEAVLERADSSGEALVVVLGDPGYYSRFGFDSAQALGITPPDGMRPEVFSIRPLSRYAAGFEGSITYPPVFATTGTL